MADYILVVDSLQVSSAIGTATPTQKNILAVDGLTGAWSVASIELIVGFKINYYAKTRPFAFLAKARTFNFEARGN